MCPESDPRNEPELPTLTFRAEHSLPLDAQLRIDQVCTAFEGAWKADEPPSIEQYLGEVAEPERAVLLVELLRVELHYRRRRGETPGREPYQTRFPDYQTHITEVFRQNSTSPEPEAITAPPAKDGCPQRIDRYQVESVLGKGGFGVVYLVLGVVGILSYCGNRTSEAAGGMVMGIILVLVGVVVGLWE